MPSHAPYWPAPGSSSAATKFRGTQKNGMAAGVERPGFRQQGDSKPQAHGLFTTAYRLQQGGATAISYAHARNRGVWALYEAGLAKPSALVVKSYGRADPARGKQGLNFAYDVWRQRYNDPEILDADFGRASDHQQYPASRCVKTADPRTYRTGRPHEQANSAPAATLCLAQMRSEPSKMLLSEPNPCGAGEFCGTERKKTLERPISAAQTTRNLVYRRAAVPDDIEIFDAEY